ncbi:MAG: GNAT family N-acetyltransferase [Bacteroidota bacterium]|nr:GNAT family N-acetyltransferase [Bacteroidota bacterium]
MEIKALDHGDAGILINLQPEGWPDIIPSFDFYTNAPFCFPVKVVADNAIAGIGAAIIHNDVAWLGHIIVHPNHRGKGIGRLITQTLVDISNQNKCETIYLIATDLGAPVYQKVGFITETEYLFFKDINTGELSGSSTYIEPYRDDFREQVSILDKLTSGEDRMFHLENHFEHGCLFCRNNIVEGFYLPTWGEGLIIANTESAGLELLKQHLSIEDKAVFPKENLAATAFLYEKGFKEIRTAKRMRLGKYRNVNLANIYNRIAGNIG